MAVQINGTSGISGVDGSASTPALQGSDSNTGISFGTDEVSINTDGTTRAKVDSSGRMLVGTSTARSVGVSSSFPSRVEIETTSFAGLSIVNNSNDATGAILALGKSRGTANGSTTAVSNGDAIATIRFSGADGTDVESNAAIISCEVDGTPGSNDMPGRLVFSTTADGASSPTARVRLTSQGFLKCSPRVDDSTHGAQRVSSPVHEFTCDDNDWVMQMTHTSGSAAESSGLYIKYRSTTPNNASSDFFYAADSTTVRAAFKSNGGLYNYSGNNSNLCDEREKKNIVNLDSTWDCLKHWEVKKFHYNEDLDTDDLRYGVIAQQVAEYCPEVITDWIKPAMEAVLDEEGNEITPAREEVARIGVKEQQMMWMAIKALQEAQIRIETLETRLAALEGGN